MRCREDANTLKTKAAGEKLNDFFPAAFNSFENVLILV